MTQLRKIRSARASIEAAIEGLSDPYAEVEDELALALPHLARAIELAERLAEPRRSSRTRDDVLDEYRFMLDIAGLSVREIPQRLGMSEETFARRMYRAKASGDKRAADFTGLGVRPDSKRGKRANVAGSYHPIHRNEEAA